MVMDFSATTGTLVNMIPVAAASGVLSRTARMASGGSRKRRTVKPKTKKRATTTKKRTSVRRVTTRKRATKRRR